MTVVFAQPAPVQRRDGNGRPYIKQPDTGKEITYQRCTTFIKALEDTYLIDRWRQRNVAHGPDLVLKAAAANGDRAELEEVIDEARKAAGEDAPSNTGSALHRLTEQLDRGIDPLVPPSSQPDIDAYRQILVRERLQVEDIEVGVVRDDLKVHGTFDRTFRRDGVCYVGDLKTGNIEWSPATIEMQLAMYASGLRYNLETGERSPLDVDQTWGIVISLPAGTGQAELRWADLSNGRAGIALAVKVWEWQGRSAAALQIVPPLPELFPQINQCTTHKQLTDLWAAHLGRGWTDEHTNAAAARWEAIQMSSPTPVA